MNKLFYILFFFTLNISAKAQLFDTIQKDFKRKPGIIVKLDSRNTFINGKINQFSGVKLGLSFNKRTRYGVGYSYLENGSSVINNLGETGFYKIHYAHVFADYVFYNKGKWEFALPVQIGIGNSFIEFPNNKRVAQKYIVLYEPNISGQYKVFKWFGIGADLGFRYCIIRNKELGNEFQSPTYTFKTLIYWDVLYKTIFPRSKYNKYL